MPEFVQQILGLAREGFAEINAFQGLFVAIMAALMMTGWSRLLIIAAGAAVAHVVLDVLAPVIAEVSGFQLPPLLDGYFWRYVAVLFVGYLVVVAILFAVKRLVIKG